MALPIGLQEHTFISFGTPTQAILGPAELLAATSSHASRHTFPSTLFSSPTNGQGLAKGSFSESLSLVPRERHTPASLPAIF